MPQVNDLDTGKVLEKAPDLSLLARELYEAQLQLRAWEARVTVLEAILRKKVIYGDVAAVEVAGRQTFDKTAWLDSLNFENLSRETMVGIIEAAKDFKPGLLPAITGPLGFIDYQPSRPYVEVAGTSPACPTLKLVQFLNQRLIRVKL